MMAITPATATTALPGIGIGVEAKANHSSARRG
jgi:hypothetical protein